MLSIAVIQRFLPTRSRGGVGYFTHGLCNALAKKGHAVTVFSQDPQPADARYDVVLLPTARSVAGYPLASLAFPFQVAQQDFSRFDIIHAQGDEHLIPRAAAPPVVRTLHGSALAEAIHNGWRRRSPRRFFQHLYFYVCELMAVLRAEAVVAVSKDTVRYYPRMARVIPNGVDLDHFSRPRAEKTEKPTILFVGELTTRKRGNYLVNIVQEQVKPVVPDVELWLVCPEKTEGKGIRWFCAVDYATLAELYQASWVFCLPSSYEGFGRPYVEAMAAGTPVVATRNPGADEVLDHGRYGMIVKDEELGNALRTLLSRKDLREEYTRRGSERVKGYAWEVVADAYVRVYEDVIEKRIRQDGRV